VCIADGTRCTKMNSYVIIIIIHTNDEDGEWRVCVCDVLRARIVRGTVPWRLACVHRTRRIIILYFGAYQYEFFPSFNLPVQV